ncbi:MAG: prepilin-type N-terminal cleavage/methylation domain-containing protein [Geothrix sp.]|nr:prepilin-type N-terminal cleavage/methylation domain-containing protein [Geothrix sp.]
MRRLPRRTSAGAQRGFSMVEMLLTAFILAVGIMGLTMLQVMALRGARGGRSLGTAVQVGEMVMDQIEMEGRLSWLNITATQVAAPAALTTLKYINKVPLATPQTFTIKGEVPVASAPDPTDSTPFYTVVIAQNNVGGVPGTTTGIISDFTVNVNFSDQVNPATGVAIPRVVTITRRILHG